jgi:hypothetical protein
MALIAPARRLDGHSAQVVAGLIETSTGPHVALRIDEDGDLVVLAPRATSELMSNLRAAVGERLKLERDV